MLSGQLRAIHPSDMLELSRKMRVSCLLLGLTQKIRQPSCEEAKRLLLSLDALCKCVHKVIGCPVLEVEEEIWLDELQLHES